MAAADSPTGGRVPPRRIRARSPSPRPLPPQNCRGERGRTTPVDAEEPADIPSAGSRSIKFPPIRSYSLPLSARGGSKPAPMRQAATNSASAVRQCRVRAASSSFSAQITPPTAR
jgi:hypothetical protein